ncbi:MAG: hypothetical protein P8K08_14765 [Fuerstiella sp.]|nr:hypothetical protein [Fuerstiella sp.]
MEPRPADPMMLTLVDLCGRLRFIPFWIEIETTLYTRPRDRPIQAFAVPYYHVTATEFGWEMDRSRYSPSLAAYHSDAPGC